MSKKVKALASKVDFSTFSDAEVEAVLVAADKERSARRENANKERFNTPKYEELKGAVSTLIADKDALLKKIEKFNIKFNLPITIEVNGDDDGYSDLYSLCGGSFSPYFNGSIAKIKEIPGMSKVQLAALNSELDGFDVCEDFISNFLPADVLKEVDVLKKAGIKLGKEVSKAGFDVSDFE